MQKKGIVRDGYNNVGSAAEDKSLLQLEGLSDSLIETQAIRGSFNITKETIDPSSRPG
jgi:hypothetical protein